MIYGFEQLHELLARPTTGFVTARNEQIQLSDDSRLFLTAWNHWRGDRLLPRRADMDITMIARLMPRVVLLEISGPERMIFRLAGGEVEQYLGQRLQGRDYVAMAESSRQERRARLMWHVVNQPCAAVNVYRASDPDGTSRLIQFCGAPVLADEPGAPVQLLAVASNLRRLGWGESGVPYDPNAAGLCLIDIGAGGPDLDPEMGLAS
ncbi:MAG: PAS domain-containing protein [Ferrovibrio sp.]